MSESKYTQIDNDMIELEYCDIVTEDNQSIFLSKLAALVDDNLKLHQGFELLVNMTNVKEINESARRITEHFVKVMNVKRVAVYGASEDIVKAREEIYRNIGKSSYNHYFKNRGEAIEWLMAERVVDAISDKEHVLEKIILYASPKGYLEIIYPENVDVQNQSMLIAEVENYVEAAGSRDVKFLVDSSRLMTFSYGAQIKSAEAIQKLNVLKVATFNNKSEIKIVKDEMYNASKIDTKLEYFKTRDEALAWLLSDEVKTE